MKSLRIFFFALTIFFSAFSYSQNTFEPLPCLNKKFGIIVHVVRDYSGNTNITDTEIQSKIDAVNNIFDSICISFEICEFRYINNFNYDSYSPQNFDLMQIAYNEANRINLYFVQNSYDSQGFATFGGIDSLNSGGIVALKNEGSGDISHLIGHYFGLFNTWEGSQTANAELVDGSNCATAGDSICDTPADPYYQTFGIVWQDNTNIFLDFIYTGQDTNGDYFTPLVGNIMSNYMNRCFFTYGQYEKIVDLWLNSSQKMW